MEPENVIKHIMGLSFDPVLLYDLDYCSVYAEIHDGKNQLLVPEHRRVILLLLQKAIIEQNVHPIRDLVYSHNDRQDIDCLDLADTIRKCA